MTSPICPDANGYVPEGEDAGASSVGASNFLLIPLARFRTTLLKALQSLPAATPSQGTEEPCDRGRHQYPLAP